MALERERESRNLEKIEEREGLYSKNRPLFICTTRVRQGESVNDDASNILKMQSIRKNNSTKSILNAVSGITLIALVVTIVVLLILASVSITVVFGDNGILQLAKEAGEKTNVAVKNDMSSIGELEDILHETQTGIVVDKVIDANPGELEVDGSNGNLLTINSIEDLVAFAHNVTSGNTYENKTVKLGLSLDFASTKSYVDANRTDYGKYGYDGELKKLLNESGFIPIGTQERLTDEEISKKSFHGTFDGDGKTIYNLKIKGEISDLIRFKGTGLFIVNYGTIEGLGVENANIAIDVNLSGDEWTWIGVLAAYCEAGGEIDKCHTSGKVDVYAVNGCDVGGVAGATGVGGTISNSYSDVDILVSGKKDILDIHAGLIAGSCNDNGTIKNVFSKGNICPIGDTKCGLVISAWNEEGMVSNSYTIGRIKAEESYNEGGGLRTFGAIATKVPLNCYYLENSIEPAYNGSVSLIFALGIKKTEEEMKSEEFVNSLNNGQEPAPWKQDTNNINDGYPILSWQE